MTNKRRDGGGTLYLHIFTLPKNHELLVPNFTAQAVNVSSLRAAPGLEHGKQGDLLRILLPAHIPDSPDYVLQVDYTGELQDAWKNAPLLLSQQFDSHTLDSSTAQLAGGAQLESKTSSRYFGNWRHDAVITAQKSPGDTATFAIRVLDSGDYKLSLEYACPDPAQKNLEGAIDIASGGETRTYTFQTCATAPFDSHQPLVFFHHPIGIVSLKQGSATLSVHPTADGPDLFWLRRVILEPQ
jgi:alpha-L-fucosidase